jgi:hypothetical protein
MPWYKRTPVVPTASDVAPMVFINTVPQSRNLLDEGITKHKLVEYSENISDVRIAKPTMINCISPDKPRAFLNLVLIESSFTSSYKLRNMSVFMLRLISDFFIPSFHSVKSW